MEIIYRTACIPNVMQNLATNIVNNYATYDAKRYENTIITFGVNYDTNISEIKTNDKEIITYNAEPLVEHIHDDLYRFNKIIDNMQGSAEVWDYSIQNIEILKKYGFNIKYRPPLYIEESEIVENYNEPKIDLLFFGSPTDHRNGLIQRWYHCPKFTDDQIRTYSHNELLINHWQIKLVWLFHIEDHDLIKQYIANSKVILDMSRNGYQDSCPNLIRMYYPLMRNKCVLTPRSDYNTYKDMVVEYDNEDHLNHLICELILMDKWKEYINYDFKSFSEQLKIELLVNDLIGKSV